MQRYCPHCLAELPSEAKYNLHLAISHESTPSGPVSDATIKSLLKIKDRVHWILLHYPATRSNDWELFLIYNRLFNGLYVYNEANQTVQFRRVIGVSVNEFLHQVSYETIRRSRQYLQAKHPEIRASERVQALRGAKEAAYKEHFILAKLGDSIPSAYVPSSEPSQ